MHEMHPGVQVSVAFAFFDGRLFIVDVVWSAFYFSQMHGRHFLL
jgi:hypothetical protein